MNLIQQLIADGKAQYDLAGNYVLPYDEALFISIIEEAGNELVGCLHKHDNLMYFAKATMNFTQAVFMLGYFDEIGVPVEIQSKDSGLVLKVENRELVSVLDWLATVPYRFEVEHVFDKWKILQRSQS